MALIVLVLYILTIAKGLWSYRHVKKVLRLWSFWQSMQLSQETELIRDNLLQYSFTIRRFLEQLPSECQTETQVEYLTVLRDCLEVIDKLHTGLVQLSDRLFPAYIHESLPLAIQVTAESWLRLYPQVQVSLEIPAVWRKETLKDSLIIIRTLEELMRITLSSQMLQTSNSASIRFISIILKSANSQGIIKVKLNYQPLTNFQGNANVSEARYLCNSFHYLTNGKCSYQYQVNHLTWYLIW